MCPRNLEDAKPGAKVFLGWLDHGGILRNLIDTDKAIEGTFKHF